MSNGLSETSRAIIAVLASGILGTGHLPAQTPATFTVTSSTNATSLAQSIVGAGVTLVGTPTLRGMAGQAGLFDGFTTGPFTNPVTNASGTVSIPRGVILSSGRVQDATGTFANGGADAAMDGPGDSALTAISGFETNDAVSLEFSFIPDSNEVFIEYLFASTEYPDFVNSAFNDVFAFFVNGVNVAVVPGTQDPVTINKINAGNPVGTQVSNPQYFTQYSNLNTPFNYGGATVLLTARATVTRGVVNTFRFAIADSSDFALDSAVFIGAGRFTTAPPPSSFAVATASLSNGQIQTPYSQTLAATGGTAPYTWALSSGTLPPGLTLNSVGVIQGTPTQQGTFNFTVRVQDSRENTATRALSITIAGEAPVITTTALPAGQALAPYSFQFTAAGGSPPFTWALASGALPSGFALTPAGVLIGTAGQALSGTFEVRVNDSAGRSATKAFTLVIAPRDIIRQNLEIATAALPDATVGKIYGMTLAGRNGVEPYSWSFSGLPEGLQGNAAGEIFGTPARAGSFPVQVALTDGAGNKATGSLSLAVKPPPLAILTERAPEGRIGEAYSLAFAAVGGVPPYAFAVSAGALPPGLALASNGILSGTPTQLGPFQFTIQVTDSTRERGTRSFGLTIRPPALAIATPSLGNGVVGTPFSLLLSATGGAPSYTWSATGLPEGLSLNAETGLISGTPTRSGAFPVSVRVTDRDREVANRNYSLEVITQVLITSTLGNIVAGTSVSTTFAATGGRAPYTWTVLNGSLPAGLSLSAEGLLTGTATTAGDSNFAIQVRDADGLTGSRAFAVRVIAQLVITTESVAPAPFSAAYSAALTATGGTPPYVWSLAGGALPAGLTLSTSGTITGTPTTAGPFSFTAQVADAATPQQTAQRTLTLQVSLPDVSGLSISVPPNPQAGQQLRVSLGIASAYPIEVAGILNLTFAPNAANNADDPAIQFSTGGRSIPFTIPAGQTQAVFRVADLGVQTGTTAGTITMAATLQAAGAPVNCNCPLNQTIVIPRSAPTISALRVTRTATGFNVVITGFSTSRELTQGTFRFAGGATLDTTELVVPLTAIANTYFGGATGAPFGGQFTLTLPFTIQGDTTTVNSVTGTLTNGSGTSQPVTATF